MKQVQLGVFGELRVLFRFLSMPYRSRKLLFETQKKSQETRLEKKKKKKRGKRRKSRKEMKQMQRSLDVKNWKPLARDCGFAS